MPTARSPSPLGKIGRELTLEEGYEAARLTALGMLGSLKRALGDLDRITAWVRVFGMVNAAPGFDRMPAVINGFSHLILELYGPEVGAHARSAVGLAELPLRHSGGDRSRSRNPRLGPRSLALRLLQQAPHHLAAAALRQRIDELHVRAASCRPPCSRGTSR
jgi:hypothetical protein